MNCLKNIQHYIECHRLLLPQEQVLVALSGGADSVALLLILQSLGYECKAVHCNFHLRGNESNRDERFVVDLCAQNNIPLHVAHFDTEQYANVHKISIEMAARKLRYDLFYRMLDDEKIRRVAVAHHQNDQAETMLLNLLRGTGIHGMRGMLPCNGRVIRPLLGITRNGIVQFLESRHQSYVTDCTNLSTAYKRNKIRLEVVPVLQEITPSVIKNMNRTAQHLADAESIYNKVLSEEIKRIVRSDDYQLGETPIQIDRTKLNQSDYKKCVLHELLFAYQFNESQEESVLNIPLSTSGREFVSSDWRLLVDRELIYIDKPSSDSLYMEELPLDGEFTTSAGLHFSLSSFSRSQYPVIEKQANIACLDKDKIGEKLAIRKAQKGDWFVPFGMKGKKLLSNFLTDLKLTKWEKENQYVLCSGNQIVWVVGRRTDNRFAIDTSTENILRVSYDAQILQ